MLICEESEYHIFKLSKNAYLIFLGPVATTAPPAAPVKEAAPSPFIAVHDYFKYPGNYAYKL